MNANETAAEATVKNATDATQGSSNTTVVTSPRRLVSTNNQRDDKLMSLIQARRRTAQTRRWRSVEDCVRQCRTTKTEEYCRLKCSRHRIVTSSNSTNSNRTSSRTYGNNSNRTLRNNTKIVQFKNADTNLISQNGDELFDTEESVHGLFFVDPASKNDSKNSKQTKENSNLLTSNNNDSKSSSKDSLVKNSEATTKSNDVRKLKYSRPVSYDTRAKRTEALRNRDKLQTNTERSLENIDPEHFSSFGQKISTTNRSPPLESRGPVSRRGPYQTTQPKTVARVQEEELEIMEYSAPRQSSTEKNKFWKTRNIIALSNHFRRNSALYSSTSQANKKLENLSTTTTIKYNTVHRQRAEKPETPIAEINNLEETTPISIINQSEILIPVPLETIKINKPFSLIINVPEEATAHGVFIGHPVEVETEAADIAEEQESAVPPETTEPIKIEYTTITRRRKIKDNPVRSSNINTKTVTLKPDTEEKNYSVIPDINHIFQNITTLPPKRDLEEVPSSISSSTSKSVRKSTASTSIKSIVVSTESPILTLNPITTPKIPFYKVTEPPYSTSTIATISSVLNNTSSRNQELDSTTQKSVNISEDFDEDTRNSSLPLSPALDYEIIAPPILTLTPITSKPNTRFHNGFNKTEGSDVKVEMQSMTPATFILGGLGMLPIIAIILFVIRQYIYRNEDKDGDLERYSNDIQPISPVVKLDQSDSASMTDESIITDRDFNRNNLRFKSLLGEGNFGQVWKAEADDLNGHLGTTRIVAVKTERVDNGQGGLKAEGEIMKKLGSHPNVVTLLGMCTEQGKI